MTTTGVNSGTQMLKDKVALITGASSGIGRAVALLFHREGAKVVVSDVDRKGGEETTHLLLDLGCDAIFVKADVGAPQDCKELVVRTISHYGCLDIACNNAGIGGLSAPTADYPLENWEKVININLSGVFYSMKYQIAAMLKNGGGSIVNVSSILGVVGLANSPAYTAAKHGVVGLTQAAALEYSAQKLRINAVGPGFIHTPMTAGLESSPAMGAALVEAHPIGRLGHPEEVAELVAWVASERASFITGAYYPVDGGYLAQ
jgi:NAD(P)-dependent dehydrogenase (short-subunit alcohol dehydrogenase family)